MVFVIGGINVGKLIDYKNLKRIIDSRAKELEFVKYIKKYKNKTIVVKYGGSALETSQKISYLVDDLIFLKQQNINVVLIHGGSRQLNKLLKEKKINNETIEGIRITTEEILKYAIDIFKEVNNLIVTEINKKGRGEIKAIGLNGNEIPITISDILDKKKYKYVGKIKKINIEYLTALSKKYIPVLSSLSQTEDHQPLNVNADTNAAEIAKKLNAEKFILMTDKDGILGEDVELLPTLDVKRTNTMLKQGIISGGMVPKVEACLAALEGHVKKVHIINGTKPHALAKEIFTDEGIGTQILNSTIKIKHLKYE